jgi:hypothetical protein
MARCVDHVGLFCKALWGSVAFDEYHKRNPAVQTELNDFHVFAIGNCLQNPICCPRAGQLLQIGTEERISS